MEEGCEKKGNRKKKASPKQGKRWMGMDRQVTHTTSGRAQVQNAVVVSLWKDKVANEDDMSAET